VAVADDGCAHSLDGQERAVASDEGVTLKVRTNVLSVRARGALVESWHQRSSCLDGREHPKRIGVESQFSESERIVHDDFLVSRDRRANVTN